MQMQMFFRQSAGRLLLGLIILLAAGGGGSAADQPAGPRRLSLEEAVNLALERNPDLALARGALEKARVGEEQARAAADDLASENVLSLDLAKVKELGPRQALAGVRLAEKGVETARNGLRLGVEQAYFGAQLARELVRVREQAVSLAGEQVQQARVAYRVGTRARTDLLAAEAQLAAAGADLATAEKGSAVANMELNRTLGLPLTEAWELTTPLREVAGRRLPAGDEVSVRQAVYRALERSAAVLKADEDLAVARLAFDLTARYYTPNVYAYRQAESDLDEARVRLDKERTGAELEVRKALLEIAEARARIEQHKKAVALTEEGLRLANLRYRAGVGTSAEVLDAQVRLSGARSALANAVFALNTAVSRYVNLSGE